MSLVGFGIIKPVIVTANAAIVLTAAQSGSLISINVDTAGGFQITLPQVQAGLNFKIINDFGALTANITITTAAANAIIKGATTQANTIALINAGGRTTITIVLANTKIGDFLDFNCDGDSWLLYGSAITAGTFTFA